MTLVPHILNLRLHEYLLGEQEVEYMKTKLRGKLEIRVLGTAVMVYIICRRWNCQGRGLQTTPALQHTFLNCWIYMWKSHDPPWKCVKQKTIPPSKNLVLSQWKKFHPRRSILLCLRSFLVFSVPSNNVDIPKQSLGLDQKIPDPACVYQGLSQLVSVGIRLKWCGG